MANPKTATLLRLSAYAPARFAAAASGDGVRAFSGIAYAGGVITDHPFFDRVAFDLASTKFEAPAPLLFNHVVPVGVVKSAAIGAQIDISGELFSDIDADAKAIAEKADRGMPWQMSVGIWPGRVDQIPAGQSVQINGQTFVGPLSVFRDNRVRETSIVPLGADDKTAAQVFHARAGEPTSQHAPVRSASASAPPAPMPMTVVDIRLAAREYIKAQAELGNEVDVATATTHVTRGKLIAQPPAAPPPDAERPIYALSPEQQREVNALTRRARHEMALAAEEGRPITFIDAVTRTRGLPESPPRPSAWTPENHARTPQTVDGIRAAARAYIAMEAVYGRDVSVAEAVTRITRG
jgi:hypothetical protein